MLEGIIESAMQLPAVSHRIKMAGQGARYAAPETLQQILLDNGSELPSITDHPDVDDDYILHQGRDHLSEEDDYVSETEKKYLMNKMQVLVMKNGTLLLKKKSCSGKK